MLDDENARLTKLVAESMLDASTPKGICIYTLTKKLLSPRLWEGNSHAEPA